MNTKSVRFLYQHNLIVNIGTLRVSSYVVRMGGQLRTQHRYFNPQEARGASTPTPQDEKEIDDIVAAIEDDDVVSVSFEGFQCEDEDLNDPNSE